MNSGFYLDRLEAAKYRTHEPVATMRIGEEQGDIAKALFPINSPFDIGKYGTSDPLDVLLKELSGPVNLSLLKTLEGMKEEVGKRKETRKYDALLSKWMGFIRRHANKGHHVQFVTAYEKDVL